jgi:hypothetical protein
MVVTPYYYECLELYSGDYNTDNIVPNGLERVSIRLVEKQLDYAGTRIKSKQPISELHLWAGPT